MIEELAPGHHRDSQVGVLVAGAARGQVADVTRRRQRATVRGHAGCEDTVLVGGRQDALQGRAGHAPGGVVEVVAAAVVGAVDGAGITARLFGTCLVDDGVEHAELLQTEAALVPGQTEPARWRRGVSMTLKRDKTFEEHVKNCLSCRSSGAKHNN